MSRIEEKAYAKVNLTLEALGRRSDGYHEVRTVLQTLDLADTVTLEVADELRLTVLPQEVGPPEENLALRAAHLLRDQAGYPGGAHVRLEKGIPVAAGLGGGSADAAAVLRGLNQLWGLALTPAELRRLGAELGTDVPFFLEGGTALGEGRGEVVTPLPAVPDTWVVLLRPQLEVEGKTRRLYELLTPDCYSDGGITRRLVDYLHWGTLSGELLYNVFDQVAQRAFADLELYRRVFLDAGAPWVHLAGSGPTLFTLLSDEMEARRLSQRLREKGLEAYLCRTR